MSWLSSRQVTPIKRSLQSSAWRIILSATTSAPCFKSSMSVAVLRLPRYTPANSRAEIFSGALDFGEGPVSGRVNAHSANIALPIVATNHDNSSCVGCVRPRAARR